MRPADHQSPSADTAAHAADQPHAVIEIAGRVPGVWPPHLAHLSVRPFGAGMAPSCSLLPAPFDDFEHPRPLSADAAARGFRYPTERERQALLLALSALPLPPQ